MSPSSDDTDVPRSFDDRAADALLTGRALDDEPALSAFVAQVRALADGPGPAPTAALAALFEAGIPAQDLDRTPLPRQARAVSWRVGGWALPLQLGLAAAACVALVLGAAAADTLPDPAQTAVADVVEAVTPLHLPRPHDADQPAPAVSPTPTTPATPPVAVAPTPDRRTPSPAATGERDTEDRGGHDGGRGDRTEVGPGQGGEDRQGESDGKDAQRPATPRPTAEPRDDSPSDGPSDSPSDGSDGSGHDDGLRSPADDGLDTPER